MIEISCYVCKTTSILTIPGSNFEFTVIILRMKDGEKENLKNGSELKFCPKSSQIDYSVTCNLCKGEIIVNSTFDILNKQDKVGIAIELVDNNTWIKLPLDMCTNYIKIWDYEMSTKFINNINQTLTSKNKNLGQILLGYERSDDVKYIDKANSLNKNKGRSNFKPISKSYYGGKLNYFAQNSIRNNKFIAMPNKFTIKSNLFLMIVKSNDCPKWIKKECLKAQILDPNTWTYKHILFKESRLTVSCKNCNLSHQLFN
jgi:hypothetical protein